MLITTSTRISGAGTTPTYPAAQVHIGFGSNSDTFFRSSGVSFSLKNLDDVQQLDLLGEITELTQQSGYYWVSQFVGKRVRVMQELTGVGTKDIKVEPKAIGHPTDDDLFLVLNSGSQLVSKEKAIELINQMAKKTKE